MTGDEPSEASEAKILNEIKNLMLNERIRPEPEFEFFSKYFATSKNDSFFEDEEEILQLINSHGIELISDVKYWSDKCKTEGLGEDITKPVPILNFEHLPIQHFSDVIEKLKELPSEWTVLQITKKFSPSVINGKQERTGVYLTRFACGELAESIHPYSIMTEDCSNSQENILKVLQSLIERRKEFYNLGRNAKKLLSAYNATNSELEVGNFCKICLNSFIKEIESYVLGPFICLLQGRIDDPNLEKETLDHVRKLVNSFYEEEKLEVLPNNKIIDFVYQLTCAAHLLKNTSMFNALKLLYAGGRDLVNVSGVMMLVENLKWLNMRNSCAIKRAKRKPLILIVDNEFEIVPWEMVGILLGQPVCRISSLHLLYSLYKYHEPYIVNGFRTVEIDCTYCLINPSQDLLACEKDMKEFLRKRIPWAEVTLGRVPDPKELLSKIVQFTAYVYCGHGSGIQYLKAKDLKRAFMTGLILLFGCSSNIPKGRGGRTPHQSLTYTYILNGCPCIVGCLQDLGSSDADAACKEILCNIMPAVVVEGSEKIVVEPKEPDVLKAVAAGRFACPKYWSRSAFVARGLPCKTVIGDVNGIISEPKQCRC